MQIIVFLRSISASINGTILKFLQSDDPSRLSPVERIGSVFHRGLYLLSLLVLIIAPIVAENWRQSPFPGFMVEQTLLVAGVHQDDWYGYQVGITGPEQITEVNGNPVKTAAEFREQINRLMVGEFASFRSLDPEGLTHIYPEVLITYFRSRDMARYFWLPYFISVVYFIIGVWVYRQRGGTRAGRNFATFCNLAAIAICLIFNLSTSHLGVTIWMVAVALMGGSFFNLALLFPQELNIVLRRFWLRFTAYSISAGLIVYGLSVLYDYEDPWAYIQSWKLNYLYTFVGLSLFLIVMAYRYRRDPSTQVRQQARLILFGSALAFLPLGFWLIVPQITGIQLPWNPVLFVPWMLIFPFTLGLAIVRYHLWDLDLIIRRTLVYSILTFTLAGLYLLIVISLGLVFDSFTRQNRTAIIFSTLAIVAIANPLRIRIQNIIDHRFYRKKYSVEQTITLFNEKIRNEVNLDIISADILEVVLTSMEPTHTSLWINATDKEDMD